MGDTRDSETSKKELDGFVTKVSIETLFSICVGEASLIANEITVFKAFENVGD